MKLHDSNCYHGVSQLEGQEYLGKKEYPLEWIVVECNEEIVPKADYATRQLQDGDIVEIVSFVGGG